MAKTGNRPAAWMQDALRDGFNALQLGRVNDASECCRRVLTAKPDLPEGHFLVGLIALETDDKRTAISAFGSITKIDPEHGAAWAQLAKLFFGIGNVVRSEEALQNAIEFGANDALVCDVVGGVHSQLGDLEAARFWFDKAVTFEPDNPPYLVNHANNEMYLGNLEVAEKGLKRALDIQPDNPNAHWVLAGLRRARDDTHIKEMRRCLDAGYPTPQPAAFVYYGLGKELEDLERWDEAFEAFAAGANARRQVIDFNEPNEIDMFEQLRKSYNASWLADHAAGHDDNSPIFIVGQPRTGTTLIERVVTAHTDVHSAGELRYFGNAVRRLSGYNGSVRFSPELFRLAADINPTQLGKAYIESSTRVRGETPRFVDKLPPNYLYLPLILAALPNAKVIHVRRNPMDACFASFKQLFADAYKHSYDLQEMARHHARYWHLMQHYREQFADRYFEIHYEEAAADLESNARALIDFLELPWQDACLDFHAQKTAVTTASAVQVREPAHTRSIGRWRHYEQQLEPMRQELQKAGVVLD